MRGRLERSLIVSKPTRSASSLRIRSGLELGIFTFLSGEWKLKCLHEPYQCCGWQGQPAQIRACNALRCRRAKHASRGPSRGGETFPKFGSGVCRLGKPTKKKLGRKSREDAKVHLRSRK